MATDLIRYDFELKEREQLDVKIVMPEDQRGVIYGVVYDKHGRPVEDAVVKLFEVFSKRYDGKDSSDGWEDMHSEKSYELKPITHNFTDECGQFLFGPLCPKKKYTVKVWFNAIKCRCDVFYGHSDKDCLKPCECKKGHKEDECHSIEIKTRLEVPAPEICG